MRPFTLSSDSLNNTSVRNPEGEDLGNVKELMIDLNSGRVAYAVLSFGGFLGLGDKLFAIPWDAFTVDTENEHFVLNVDKDRLEDAPGFDKDNWPRSADANFVESIYTYYDSRPYWTA